MREVVIVSAVRTAIGSFGGSLKDVPSSELGAIVIKEAVNRAGIKPELVEEVVMGNVIQAAQGQNVARQAAVKAGLPVEVPAMTINKVCGSGLRCVALAAQMIKAGDCDVVVAGGMENMSLAPYVLPHARFGYRMNTPKDGLVDAMVHDALWDAFNEAKEVFWSAKKSESLKKIQNIIDRKKNELESLKKKIEDLQFRIEIAPNPNMKEDFERELHLKENEMDKLEASIAEDEKKISE